MPDDWRYEFIVGALDALSEADDPDDIALEPDIYTHELTSWLGSRNDRPGYCDEAQDDGMVPEGASITDRIGAGQVREKEEVLGLVRAFLEARLDEAEDEDEDE